MASQENLDLKKILSEQSANPLLGHVHADPELNVLCTKIGQGITDLLELIKSETLAQATVGRLQMVIVDGGALLASCVGAKSASAVPASVLSSIDNWANWVDQLCTEMALRKDEPQRT
jgi:hypothetical protein